MTPANLRATRKRLGLSAEALGALLGVHRETVYRWELGTRAMPSYLDRALRDLERELAPRPAQP